MKSLLFNDYPSPSSLNLQFGILSKLHFILTVGRNLCFFSSINMSIITDEDRMNKMFTDLSIQNRSLPFSNAGIEMQKVQTLVYSFLSEVKLIISENQNEQISSDQLQWRIRDKILLPFVEKFPLKSLDSMLFPSYSDDINSLELTKGLNVLLPNLLQLEGQ